MTNFHRALAVATLALAAPAFAPGVKFRYVRRDDAHDEHDDPMRTMDTMGCVMRSKMMNARGDGSRPAHRVIW